jgi:hypothetical protein
VVAIKHDNVVYDDGINTIEKVGSDYNLYDAGNLKGIFSSLEKCQEKLGDSYSVKGEFAEPCNEKFSCAVEDFKFLKQFHSPELLIKELEKEVGIESL